MHGTYPQNTTVVTEKGKTMSESTKDIAFELIGKYKLSARVVIWKYSTDIETDLERLEKECQEYEDRIRRSSDG